jgi:cell division protein FtsN
MALGSRGASRSSPRRGRPRTCVWWFLFGVLVGGFGVGSYWMTVAPTQVPPPVTAIHKSERPAPPQPKFNFPNILKDTEVDIRDDGKPLPPPAPRPEPPKPVAEPVEPTEPTPPADKPKAEKPKADTATAGQTGTYILQVASFKTAKDAEHMKAQLAMLGVSTRIQSVTLKDGTIWHRVVTGHLKTKKAVDETRAALKKHGKDAVPIKVK